RWLAERKRTLPSVIAVPGTAFKEYRIDKLPQVVMIDRDGAVAHHWAGLTGEKELRQAIEALAATHTAAHP
ncbi:MAG: hypothetical protein M3Z32_03660, partial [Acidobacteriota bacterium]|nr:hypothetical protein [Acidobacteriota bacterium]